jgi:RimJ/RimL family protein N-acetyltransferase
MLSKVYIRPLERTDLQRTHKWINEPEIGELMGCLPMNAHQQEKWFENTIDNRSKFIFAICTQSDGEHVGNVGLSNIDYINRNAMLSIFIADPKHRSKGYGFQSILLALTFAYYRLSLNKVYLKTSDYLVEAIKFYRKIGFVEEGVLRRHEYKQGRFIDKHLFSMLRDEFDAQYKEMVLS